MSECREYGIITVEAYGNIGAPPDGYCYQCEIDHLTAENARMREALERIAGFYATINGQPPLTVRIAREALTHSDDATALKGEGE